MTKKSVFYAILMVLFGIFTYLFIYSAIDTKTKVYVNYQEKSDVLYKVYLSQNDIYKDSYLGMGDSYISKITDYIDFSFDYQNLFDRNINGYYSYNVSASLVAYTDDINDSLWEKEYKLHDDKVSVIDKNNVNLIDISGKVQLDYVKYREELLRFSSDYEIDVSGYLLVKFNVNTMLDFQGLDNTVEDSKVIKVVVPLTNDIYKINIINEYDNIDSYYDFSTKESLNYIFLLMGIFSLSVFLTLFVMIIREIVNIYRRESKYTKKLREILKEYEDIIINVNRFYNKKKYNLIYVDSFNELIDVYNKVNMPISFKEFKKNYEAMFVIIDDDNAWIYKMMASDFE